MTLKEIDENQKLVDQGKMTPDEAQERVREFMLGKKQSDGTRPINKDINLGENGYLLAYTQYDKNYICTILYFYIKE
jgi:methyl-accepting chemotaxis protein